ncbi:MAG: orotidine-5'-phosphate decarboxylase [Phycisphaeraceae bacterium]|nr:orotidine-5'-phosphate decarboxylase [Phycisphaeraceae bacterium]
MTAAPAHAADLLAAATRATRSPVCVGLDPVIENLPAALSAGDAPDRIEQFSRGVLESIRGIAPAVKFQSACFERYGWQGVRALERVMGLAREQGFVLVLDAKRGDIGISATHYAVAAANAGAHFVTVNGYLGPSGIIPFLEQGLGVFVLVRTSNPDSTGFQAARLDGGKSVAEWMASSVSELGRDRVGALGLSDVGAVVGATQSAEAALLRRAMPDQIFLIPGFGAQGGTADDVRAMVRRGRSADQAGVLVTASRSVIFPKPQGADWKESIRNAAAAFAGEVALAVAPT